MDILFIQKGKSYFLDEISPSEWLATVLKYGLFVFILYSEAHLLFERRLKAFGYSEN
jgi:hypothetical protein